MGQSDIEMMYPCRDCGAKQLQVTPKRIVLLQRIMSALGHMPSPIPSIKDNRSDLIVAVYFP